MRQVLLLNNGGEVLDVVPWSRAISLECRGKVRIQALYDDVEIRSGQGSWQLPSIIMLNRYINIPFEKRVSVNKRNLSLRDNFTCQYCGELLTLGSATIDHIIPVSRGGKTTWRNVTLSCKKCNNRKDNRTPQEAKMHLRRKPFTPTRELFFLAYVRKPGYESWRPFFKKSIRRREVGQN